MSARVMVLCEGLIRREGKAIIEAHSSSTLVDTGAELLVVDTSSPAYRPKVVASLERLGVRPRNVGVLVITHDHYDHCSNNDLFPQARIMVHHAEPSREGEESQLGPYVRLVRTPGHTPGSTSVFVEAERRYAIVGDAIPTIDNYLKWVPPGLNYDAEKALRSMRRIVDWADVVIPGHGPAFEIKG